MLLKHPCEVLRIFKAQLFCRARNTGSADKQILGFLHDKTADDVAGRVVSHLADEVSEIVGRKKEFLGAVFHRRKSVGSLLSLIIVASEQVLKPSEQVIG